MPTGVGVGKREVTVKEREELLSRWAGQSARAAFPTAPGACRRYLEVVQPKKRTSLFATFLIKSGADVLVMSPDEANSYFLEDIQTWAGLVEMARIEKR